MLKYFGLKEILFGLKRAVIFVLAVTLIFTAVGYILYDSEDGDNDKVEMFYSSRSYIISAKNTNSNVPKSTNDIAVANTASTMLTADFAKQYVLDKLLESYSVKEIVEFTGATDTSGATDYSLLNGSIVSKVLENTAIINFYVKSFNEDFSKQAVSVFEDYLNDVVPEKVSALGALESLGGTTVLESKFLNESSPSLIKYVIIFAIIGFILSVCVVLAFVLFKPTVATKMDFEEYGIKVLDDCSEHKAKDYAYSADIIARQVSNKEYKTLAVVSTVKCSCMGRRLGAVTEKLFGAVSEALSIVTFLAITENFEEFKTVKEADAVILVERKGATYHKDLANTLALLQKYDIKVEGVILI